MITDPKHKKNKSSFSHAELDGIHSPMQAHELSPIRDIPYSKPNRIQVYKNSQDDTENLIENMGSPHINLIRVSNDLSVRNNGTQMKENSLSNFRLSKDSRSLQKQGSLNWNSVAKTEHGSQVANQNVKCNTYDH